MDNNSRFLIPVCESASCGKAVAYAARVLACNDAIDIHLLVILPPTPSEFLEFIDIEEMHRQQEANAAGQGPYMQWMREAVAAARPTLVQAREVLTRAGIADSAIHDHYSHSVCAIDVAQHALDYAHRLTCETIVLCRSHQPWYRRLLHREDVDIAVHSGQGLTIWVVE